MNEEAFKADVERAMHFVMANAVRDGTTGLSLDCFYRLVVPKVSRVHAPLGTNGGWFFRATFNELARKRPFSQFIYTNQLP